MGWILEISIMVKRTDVLTEKITDIIQDIIPTFSDLELYMKGL